MSIRFLSASSTLSPATWPFNLKWLPRPAFLVGGIVRDALLGRKAPNLDLDFVMPAGAVETAQAIAHHYRAGFVLLDAERQIARVVFDQATADFAQQVGPSLEIDLHRRDFTVNAMAYNPHTDELIDPLQGYLDLQRGQLRMIAVENLKEDPLRLLRAYRQAAQLSFTLDADTQAAIRCLSPALGQIAAERVQAELSYLLSTSKGTPWLTTAWEDGLLETWFPSATSRNLELLAAIEQAAIVLSETRPDFGLELNRGIREKTKGQKQGSAHKSESVVLDHSKAKITGSRRTWLSTARLTSLLAADLAQAEAELLRLKYSRAEIQAVITVLKFLPQVEIMKSWFQSSSCPGQPFVPELSLSRRDQYFLFQGAGSSFPALALLAVALGVPVTVMAPLIDRFLTPYDPVAHPVPLLTGQDLMNQLQISPGPQIGQLLAAIQLAYAEGKIATSQEAVELARDWIKQEKP